MRRAKADMIQGDVELELVVVVVVGGCPKGFRTNIRCTVPYYA